MASASGRSFKRKSHCHLQGVDAMSKQQPPTDPISGGSKYLKGPADSLSRLSVERRTLLLGAAAVAANALPTQASAAPQAPDLSAALEKFRATIPSHFDREYVENAVVPFFLGSIFAGERPILPMIDLPLTKQDAIPYDFWGMLYEDWKPTPSEGVTVFLEGLENRGDNNLRKRIYFTGVTPDLYAPKYQAKVVAFFDKLLELEARRQAVHAPLPRLLLGHLLGSASRREGRRRAASSPHDRGELQHGARLSQSPA